jgi:BirA family biotin operon repressor/biotin-[acetyl-CoA-carboxylase] ligase
LRSSRSDTAPPELEGALSAAADRIAPLGARLFYFNSVGSTNDVAADLAAARDAEGAIVIADAQTAGRGRRGRSWFSPPGSGLYVSVVLAPGRSATDPQRATSLLTIAAGVALTESIEAATGLAPAIKWPNDILVGRRKLAGILAEAVADAEGVARPSPDVARPSPDVARPFQGRFDRQVVLGYGLNVGPMAYPPELTDRATSLESELGRAFDRTAVLVESLAALSRRYRDLVAGRFDAILDAWRQRAPAHRGAQVSWESAAGIQTGITCGIDDDGALLVRAGDRVERIVAGEVSFHATGY